MTEEAYCLLGNTLHAEAVNGNDETADKSFVEALAAFRFDWLIN